MSGQKKFHCEICDYTANNNYNFERHLTTKKHKKAKKDDNTNEYHCESCDYTTSDFSNFQKHLATKKHLRNTGQVKKVKRNRKPTYCHICEKEYATHNCWRVHQYIHTNPASLFKQLVYLKVTMDGRRKRYERTVPLNDRLKEQKIRKQKQLLQEAKDMLEQVEGKKLQSEMKIKIRRIRKSIEFLKDDSAQQELAEDLLRLEKKFNVLKDMYNNPSKEMKKRRKEVSEHTISASDLTLLKDERNVLKAQLEDLDEEDIQYDELMARLHEVNGILLNHMD